MSTKPKEPELTYGLMTGSVRAINVDKREAEFVAATEGGVQTWGGIEFLDMDGLDLTRFKKNPVLLDTHDRWTVGSVIGNATVKVEKRQLINLANFAQTERAEDAWQLVKDGFVRAVSVGFLPKKVLDIEEGETHKLGEQTIDGPARIITKWELFEISVVPVPADPDAVRRVFMDGDTTGLELTARAFARTLATMTSKPNENRGTKIKPPEKEERQMTTPNKETPPKKEEATKKEETREAGPAYEREAIDAEIRGICSQFPNEGTRCILGEMTVEQSRVHMRQYLAEKSPPAGANGDTNQSTKTEEKREVSADEILRSIGV